MKGSGSRRLSLSAGGAVVGAAFLMANSSIGPGFLTQTTVFTAQLLTSFGFVILVSVLLDIGAQLNTWRILTVSGQRAQDLANQVFPGLGYLLCLLVVLGGFAFNIGNIAGCGLGMNVLFGLSFRTGAALSGALALLLFWSKEIGRMLDNLTKVLGVLKIGLTFFVACAVHPPLGQALAHTFVPSKVSAQAIVTIVGGTVGGYITFSGAHRLLDAGISGRDNIKRVNASAVSGILISTLMRFVLFLAVVGAIVHGAVPDKDNPAASVFAYGAGAVGLHIFGLVLWSAALSSVMGASYTAVSFFKTFHPVLAKYEKAWITLFIVVSTLIFMVVGKPRELLLLAGLVNGFILPFALAVLLVGATRPALMQGYRHPLWMQAAGWIVVLVMGGMSIASLF
ncbi:NRAMP family divalent metal transporter [Dinghuibacter silviterrae]|uniref:Mn2+/Fe2+ NRAMP family transporter n=1 Tax=Dinghuibacter silviterrae TaxID=1539049 RepID=A0A4R8DQ22_9BACT|nr:NRAMP family divalent metal transporter [Dinghuibacter silviterrae]TDW99220.1 Mn2+/Fe2+ NRAMP family transporter [Dinghuibacter silviterrae]